MADRVVPQPDPTNLTTQQLDRVIDGLRDLVVARIEASEGRLGGRNDALLERVLAVERMLVERDARWTERALASQHDLDKRDKFLSDLADERQSQVQLAFDAQQQAVTKAEAAAEKRFDSVNEFRAQLSDQARDFMPRRESELQMISLSNRVEELQRAMQTLVTDSMPRGEVRLVLEALTTRVDGMGASVTNVSTLLATLRSSLAGQDDGGAKVREEQTRSRNFIIGISGTIIALMGLAITLILALR